ncbi:restriction endonuclease subunit S [Pectobacterium brasiliense]|uniref:restriction endonuclease subunit S n=1 Tax=Pectobacterium brasiliense TaxID=180957 RepID=UPI00196941DF|nr:restriction endonuclease subunit S [Pectobacterium brasiliense]MBN3263387.1 restriction endonuclease subunit S [Pectobacterium brasiliense]
MSGDNKVPEIRFKGFSGEWENLTLGNLGSIAMNKRIFKHQTTITGDVPFFKIGTFGKQPDAFISKALFDEYKAKYPYPVAGDLLLSASGSIGRVVEYKGEEQYFQDSNIVWLKHDGKIDNAFLKVFYSMVKWSGLEGSTIKRLYNKNILETEISTPERQEQTAIGNYFQKLDALINQHQQKHDKLSNIKKAMLEKMFPKQGETFPEIRFKGFSGEWEEISLLDSIERIIDFRGRTPKKLGLDWSPSGYRALSALNVKQGYIDFSIDPHFGDQELYDKWMSGAELHQGQVLFTTEAPMGNIAQVPNTDKYILSQRTIAFITKSEIIAEDFLAVLLRSSKVFRELSALSSGGTAKGVSQKVLANLNVSIPTDLVEQATIGNYFQKLDALIDQHQQQITKLNNIKQACLSKMFV